MPGTEPNSVAKRDPTKPWLKFTIIFNKLKNQTVGTSIYSVSGVDKQAAIAIVFEDGKNNNYGVDLVAIFEGHHQNIL